MAINRQATAFLLLRVLTGVFFLFNGLSKLGWFISSQPLAAQLSGWLQATAPGSISHRYVASFALPLVTVFARLVPAGEIACGVALIGGMWTATAAAIAFLMVVNFHLASGMLFRYAILTNGYGLPVLGSTLALAIGSRK